MKPLAPQPHAYVAWEDEVTEAVAHALQVCRSDAQAIAEGQGPALQATWLEQLDAQAAAVRVIEAATPAQAGGATA
jgi:hypothetical protein